MLTISQRFRITRGINQGIFNILRETSLREENPSVTNLRFKIN